MSRSAADRALALAGVFQAAALVDETARTGSCDPQAREGSMHSLFQFDAPDTLSVFGDLAGIRIGLRSLAQQLESGADNATLRYAMALMTLSRRASEPRLLKEISDGLATADRLQAERGLADPSVIDTIGATYLATVSKLQPRVIVSGEPSHLRQPATAALIRSLLMAGVRAGILWRQSGGSRRYLLFSRQRLVHEARKLLEQAE